MIDDLPENPKTLEEAIIDKIGSDSLRELAIETSEITLDAILTDEFIKEIPVLGVIYKTYKATIGIRESIFAKTVLRFLNELKDISAKNKLSFINDFETKKTYKKKVGEKLIMILDKLDDIDKASIIGKLFKVYILGRISYSEFTRLSSVVQRAILQDLEELKQNRIYFSMSDDLGHNLSSLGIASPNITEGHTKRYNELGYKVAYQLNQYGNLLYMFGLSEEGHTNEYYSTRTLDRY